MGTCISAKRKEPRISKIHQKNDSNNFSRNSSPLIKQITIEAIQQSLRSSKTDLKEYQISISPTSFTPILPCGSSYLPPITIYSLADDPQNFPIQKSKLSDWTNTISEFLKFKPDNLNESCKELKENYCLSSVWEKLIHADYPGVLLKMFPMAWLKEQLALISQLLSTENKRSKVVVQKELSRLSETFKWFLWAVGNYLYLSIAAGDKEIGKYFKILSQGASVFLPTKLRKWFMGFVFKGVKFKLTYKHSDEARRLRSEFKAMKIFNLGFGPAAENLDFHLVNPLLMFIDIGPLSLFAVPVFNKSMLTETEAIEFEIFDRSLVIGQENILKVQNLEENRKKGEKKCVLVFNFSEIVPENKQKALFLVLKTDNKVIEVRNNHYSNEVPESIVREMLSDDQGNVSSRTLKYFNIQMYGWDCYVYYEEIPKKLKKNEIGSLFGTEIFGDAVISVHQVKKQYSRFPLFSVPTSKLKKTIKRNIKDCVKSLESNKNLSNSQTFKELLHRKGLRYYYLWIVYARCRQNRVRILIECDLLARAVNKVVNSKLSKSFSFIKYRELIINLISPLLLKTENTDTQLVYLSLFLERLKCVEDYENFKLGKKKLSKKRNFLYSSKIIDKIINCAQNQPGHFLKSLEFHLNIKFSEPLLSATLNDSYYFTINPKALIFSDLTKFELSIHSILSLREEYFTTLLKITDQENVNTSVSSLTELVLPCDLYSFANVSIFKPVYTLPSAQFLQEFLNCVDPVLKDLQTIDGGESFICEILFLILSQLHITEGISNKVSEALEKIDDVILNSLFILPEIIIAENLWTAFCIEELNVPESEQLYITSLVAMTRLMGDPRGRGNYGVPWQLLVSLKISQICRESQRFTDAYVADEHFDSIFYSSSNLPFQNQGLLSESESSLNYWILNNSLISFNSGKMWSRSCVQQVLQSSKIKNTTGSVYINMSRASTPASFRNESRRGLSQSSLTAVLRPENGALCLPEMKGFIYTWGKNQSGELGISNSAESQTLILPFPRLVTSLKNHLITDISIGAEHCIAISFEGIPFVWGNNNFSQLGLEDCEKVLVPSPILGLPKIKFAACGYEHSLLITHKGIVYSMGQGEGGALGHGNVETQKRAKAIKGLKSTRIESISAGAYHSVAVSYEGKVFVWGRGEGGQLGIEESEIILKMSKLGISGSDIYVHTPCQLFGVLKNRRVIKVSCGEAHTIALTDNFEVFLWGWGSNGQLGTGYLDANIEEGNKKCIQYLPTHLNLRKNIIDISAGGLFSMFLTKENELFACGMNDFSQLGIENPKQEHLDVPEPTQLVCFLGCKVKKIACGESHSVAVTETGKNYITWAWGRHKEGQLGVGAITAAVAPRPVQVLNNANVVKVQCGRRCTGALIGEVNIKESKTKSVKNRFAICYFKEA